MKIAYIIYQDQNKYTSPTSFDENPDLLKFLLEKGLDIEARIWDDPEVDWQQYDLAILKSPWDYHEKFDAFNVWLNHVEAAGVRLLNSYQTVRWNMDKHYLQEIIDAGFDVIPSAFLAQADTPDLESLFEILSADKIIVKPCISGGSKNTIALLKGHTADYANQVNNLLLEGSYVVQPFMQEIKDGEWSFIFFNGQFSHCLIKKPKEGDFRVQQFFGGTIHPVEPDAEIIKKAKEYLDTFGKDTFYARIDGVMNAGGFVLMEIELIEPYLYLAYHPDAVNNYYKALVSQINKH